MISDVPQKTRVVHVNDKIPDAVYVGRAMPRQGLQASRFANPFKIGDPVYGTDVVMSRDDVIEAYRVRLLSQPSVLLAELPALRGKPLCCWCRRDGEAERLDNACHGDVLVNLLDAYTDDELRAMAQPIAAESGGAER